MRFFKTLVLKMMCTVVYIHPSLDMTTTAQESRLTPIADFGKAVLQWDVTSTPCQSRLSDYLGSMTMIIFWSSLLTRAFG